MNIVPMAKTAVFTTAWVRVKVLFWGKPSYQPMSGGSLQMVYFWDYMAYQMIPGFVEKHGRIIVGFGKLMVNYNFSIPPGKLT